MSGLDISTQGGKGNDSQRFWKEREELNLTQLSKITGNYKSTTLRLSRSLENYGYLEKEHNWKYNSNVFCRWVIFQFLLISSVTFLFLPFKNELHSCIIYAKQ